MCTETTVTSTCRKCKCVVDIETKIVTCEAAKTKEPGWIDLCQIRGYQMAMDVPEDKCNNCIKDTKDKATK